LFIAAITPGPNNVMLTASGMNFGYKKTIPHILGVIMGFTALILLCALGVAQIYESSPLIKIFLKYFGACYLIYLSYRILSSGNLGLRKKAAETIKPLTFLEAFTFQFVNPKGVIFGISSLSLLPPDLSILTTSAIATISTITCSAISTNLWTLFGKGIARFLNNNKIRILVNIILVIMLLSTLPMILA
jgi:threonine/homoserine/homoserine lactone efflux protein